MRGKQELTLSLSLGAQLLKCGFLQHEARVARREESRECAYLYAHIHLDYYVLSLRRWANEMETAEVNVLFTGCTWHYEVISIKLNKIENAP